MMDKEQIEACNRASEALARAALQSHQHTEETAPQAQGWEGAKTRIKAAVTCPPICSPDVLMETEYRPVLPSGLCSPVSFPLKSAHTNIVASQVSFLLTHILFHHTTATQGASHDPVVLSWIRMPRLAKTKDNLESCKDKVYFYSSSMASNMQQ